MLQTSPQAAAIPVKQRGSELGNPKTQHTLVPGAQFTPSFFPSSQMAQNLANVAQTLLQGRKRTQKWQKKKQLQAGS